MNAMTNTENAMVKTILDQTKAIQRSFIHAYILYCEKHNIVSKPYDVNFINSNIIPIAKEIYNKAITKFVEKHFKEHNMTNLILYYEPNCYILGTYEMKFKTEETSEECLNFRLTIANFENHLKKPHIRFYHR